jgi:chromosome segregation ATPase
MQVCHLESLSDGSTPEEHLQLADGVVAELEGQVQEVQRRHKAELDALMRQLEAARGVQREWQGVVEVVREAKGRAIDLVQAARKTVKELEQQVEVVRKEEASLLQQLEAARVKVRAKEEVEAVRQAWSGFCAEVAEAKTKLRQREEELASMGKQETEDMLEVESARRVLQEQEQAVAAVLEASGDLGAQLAAAKQTVKDREEEVVVVKEALQGLLLQLEAARGAVWSREEEMASHGGAQGGVQFLQRLHGAAGRAERKLPQSQQHHQPTEGGMQVQESERDAAQVTQHVPSILHWIKVQVFDVLLLSMPTRLPM